jgi:hypothetical protein
LVALAVGVAAGEAVAEAAAVVAVEEEAGVVSHPASSAWGARVSPFLRVTAATFTLA